MGCMQRRGDRTFGRMVTEVVIVDGLRAPIGRVALARDRDSKLPVHISALPAQQKRFQLQAEYGVEAMLERHAAVTETDE